MTAATDQLVECLLRTVNHVRAGLGLEAVEAGPDSSFADLLDSMGLVEFLAALGDECGVSGAAVEASAAGRFGTVGELATAMQAAGILPRGQMRALTASPLPESSPARVLGWLAGCTARLPAAVQTVSAIDTALGRPEGWLERHAGIHSRRLWKDEDPIAAAADAARESLERAGVLVEEVGAMLVTAETPPLIAGLAAALHHRVGLRPQATALEVGGACTGFLACLWLARQLVQTAGAVLIVAVEAPSRYLITEPGPAGEAAALFGDGAAACVLIAESPCPGAVPLLGVALSADGAASHLLGVESDLQGSIRVRMDGRALAGRAVRAMADQVRELTSSLGVEVADLHAVVAHGGNGRMPALLARQLGLPAEKVWSETPTTGNLGSASLPVAWAAQAVPVRGPVAWVAAGAGLTVAAALTGDGIPRPA